MNDKTRASRGATAGLSNAFREVSTERYAAPSAPRQASHIASRYGLSPLHAAVIAELAFPSTEHWRGRV